MSSLEKKEGEDSVKFQIKKFEIMEKTNSETTWIVFRMMVTSLIHLLFHLVFAIMDVLSQTLCLVLNKEKKVLWQLHRELN